MVNEVVTSNLPRLFAFESVQEVILLNVWQNGFVFSVTMEINRRARSQPLVSVENLNWSKSNSFCWKSTYKSYEQLKFKLRIATNYIYFLVPLNISRMFENLNHNNPWWKNTYKIYEHLCSNRS